MIRSHRNNRIYLLVFIVLALGALASRVFVAVDSAIGQAAIAAPSVTAGSPTSDEIVQQLIERNRQRAEQLKSYSDVRHYTISYHGFPSSITATMVVEAFYDAPSTKRFRIVSQTGSKLLVDRVLKRLLDTEKEAAQNPDQTALTPANYTFSLLGEQTVAGRQCYALHVDPKVDSKFLYRGKIWVDKEDYAVTQIEAEPSKNPSFWIKKTQVHHVYTKTGQFWLPEQNRSESNVHLGGTAVLTIDYGAYHVEP